MEPGAALQETLAAGAALRGLELTGCFAPEKADGLGSEIRSVVMLSPGPGFWPVFTASHEYQGGLPSPMDRWSGRVIGRWASELGAEAYFPFTGPPYHPFYSWATRAGAAWASPVSLLVGARAGLNVSFRGALGLRETLDLSGKERPCWTCARPCERACPVSALSSGGYDVERCKGYLRGHPQSDCQLEGCRVRRACPASRPQSPEHAQFHMAAFLT